MKRILAAAVAALSLGVAAAPAQAVQIYSAPSGLTGNQNWTGSLGLDFTVLAPIRVDALGVFDSSGNGLQQSIAVTIYDRLTQIALLTPIVFAAGTPSSGAPYIFQSIAPLILGPGSYQLTAWGYDNGEPNFNYGFIQGGDGGPISFDSLGGRLIADSTHYSSGTGYANSLDDGNTRYGAGSMLAEAVPEPISWMMMVGGFGLLGASMRKRRTSLTFG